MTRVYNFSPGPATLPVEVLQRVQADLLDWQGAGMSVMEMSHRGKDFLSIAEKAETDLRELLGIPDNYKVLFLQGGASGQFAMVPMNLLGPGQIADYVKTGHWSKKAIAEAERFGKVKIVADSEDTKFTSIPPFEDWKRTSNAAYLHYTPNETIQGVEFHWVPVAGEVPLVADMSSTLLSRSINVSKYAIIYAGAQKNLGPAGITIVIVREDLIGRAREGIPSLSDYGVQAKSGSMANTPPAFAWYVTGLVFDWVKQRGGLTAIGDINRGKAERLYAAIDGSDGYYRNPVDVESRSRMNVPFTLVNPDLDAGFLKESAEAGLVHLKGHRAVGGMRASIYNAMPEEGIDKLIEFMQDFKQRNG